MYCCNLIQTLKHKINIMFYQHKKKQKKHVHVSVTKVGTGNINKEKVGTGYACVSSSYLVTSLVYFCSLCV